MTVREVIEMLTKMPQDLKIVDTMLNEIDGCHVDTSYFDGDPANPNCPIIEAVILE